MIKTWITPLLMAIPLATGTLMVPAVDAAQVVNMPMATESQQQSDSELLQQKLALFNGYAADFKQTVKDVEGNLIHQASGELIFKQPGKFIWQVNEPEEELLISNGQYVWWYNPFVEQVSIFDVNQAVTQTPFALLVSKDPAIWQQFEIVKSQDSFIVTPKDPSQAQVIELKLVMSGEQLATIFIKSRSQQVSEYQLSNQRQVTPSDQQFSFDIPIGVDIDDQRPSSPTVDGNVSY